MKIKANYVLRQVADSYMVVPVGSESAKVKGIITLNETAARIWEELKEETTEKVIIEKLCQEYDLSEEQMREQVKDFVDLLKEKDFLEWDNL